MSMDRRVEYLIYDRPCLGFIVGNWEPPKKIEYRVELFSFYSKDKATYTSVRHSFSIEKTDNEDPLGKLLNTIKKQLQADWANFKNQMPYPNKIDATVRVSLEGRKESFYSHSEILSSTPKQNNESCCCP